MSLSSTMHGIVITTIAVLVLEFGSCSYTFGEILIQDNFESSNLNQWIDPWGNVGSSNPSYGFITSSEKYEGNYSFQETIPPNQPEGGKLRFSFANNPQKVVYARWFQKWADPWDPLTASKMIILIAGNAPNGPTTADLQIIADIHHYADGRAIPGEFLVEHSNYINGQTVYRSHWQNIGTKIIRQTDRWYCFEVMVDAGTPGNSDGVIKYWIDGQLKADHQNLNLLPLTNYSQQLLFHWLIVTNYADPIAQTRTSWYDDFVLSTGPVGCGIDITAPASPIGLKVR